MSGNQDESPDSDDSSDSGDDSSPPETTQRQYAIVVLAAIAAVVVGAVFASVAYNATNTAEQPEPETQVDGTVAVVAIEGPIAGSIGEQLEDQLREIRANDSIEAVVLSMNTPGGSPQPTEKMYMSIQRTNKEMPVLASVGGMSASAGYYMMMPADDIYVLPTSIVGSVGLAAGAPRAAPPVRGPSGPDKRGANVIETWAYLDTLGTVFLETVMEQRGDRIELSREEVAQANIYPGVDAVENGMADEIGSIDDAVADAADRAGLENYTISEYQVSAFSGFPVLAKTDHGMVVIHNENPSYADVQPLRYAWVYEPAIPHIDELQQIVSPEIEEIAREKAQTNTTSPAESTAGGDQP